MDFCTCAYKTGAASLNEIIIVRQDEGAPLLHLQAILATGDSPSAVNLGGLEVLRTQPLLINHLEERHREGKAGGGDSNELGKIALAHNHTHMYTVTCMCISRSLCSYRFSQR